MTITIPVKFEADGSDLEKEINQSVGAGSKASKALKSAAVPAAAALAGLGALAVKFGNAAADDAKAQALLASALKNSAGASSASIAASEEFITKMSLQAAVADDELRPALANLVRGTGDVKIAQRALVTALDVSAATGKPLATVSLAVSKAYGGQATALKRLIPSLSDATLKSGDMDAIMGELAETTGGAAAAAANSTAGQMEGMRIAMGEAEETIGQALLPALSFLAVTLASVATFVQENSTVVLILGGVLGGLAATVLIVNGAIAAYAAISTAASAITKGWAAVQAAFNAVLIANPIGVVVIAIAALIAIIVVVATKTEFFQTVWKKAWAGIKTAFSFVFNFIKTNWPLILAILTGPIGIAVLLIVKNFTKIKEFAGDVLRSIIDLFLGIPKAINDLAGKMLDAGKSLMKALFNGIVAGAKGVGGFVSSVASALKEGINDLLNLPLTIGPVKVLGKTVLPQLTLIPQFATGTDFAPGGVALVGEEGPELVNLPRGSQVLTAAQTRDSLGDRGSITVEQNFYGPNTSAGRLRELEWTLKFATGRLPRQGMTAEVA